ncbi:MULTISPECIES: MFS transporter [Streptomyces]|uniref:MFS transporter n=1 Tax=Streptomyces TaxID=1883 RepID=UPI00163B6DD2|nr:MULTISPECIES: MFS transporter [Streptomyces]MBC2878376.1 MFS transporter [Streptomyces sp. TYQ1024]UBI40508.1 MFS transporter [Streptomyces mobaraensis]UKW33090.1 MFS transporter [Streptomyces sp. TYQ1024]
MSDLATLPTAPARALERDFRLLWVGSGISQLCGMATVVAFPLLAARTLGATVGEVGLITAAGYLPWLVLTLPAGVYGARLRPRTLLLLADLGRAVIVTMVPVLAATEHLALWHLYLSNVLVSCATVFYEIVYLSMPPRMLPKDRLVHGNVRLQMARAVSLAFGPAVAGFTVQVLGPERAPLLNVGGFAASAACNLLMRANIEAPGAASRASGLGAELAEAFRFVARRPVILASIAGSALGNCCFAAYEALVVLFLADDVGVAPGTLGLLIGSVGIGGLIGAFGAGRVARRLGTARAVWIPAAVFAPAGLLLPLTRPGSGLFLFLCGALLFHAGYAVFTVGQATLVQLLTPSALLQRTVACVRFVSRGMLFVGGLVGGALGSLFGPRLGLAVVMLLWIGAPLVTASSRLRFWRDIPPTE